MRLQPTPIQLQALSDFLFADLGTIYFKCPGCDIHHGVQVVGTTGPVWLWDNDVNTPTITPSIRVRSYNEKGETVCHLYVTKGKLQFLNDCTHELKGQTADMIPMTLGKTVPADQT